MSVRRGLGMTKNEEIARSIALVLPLLLLLGALGTQYLGGLYPCEMCHWQRWPHYSAVLLAAGAKPNLVPPTGETPLMIAARMGNLEASKLLIAHGAEVNAKEAARNRAVPCRGRISLVERHHRLHHDGVDGGHDAGRTARRDHERADGAL